MTLNRTQAPSTYSPTEFDYHLPDCEHRILPNGINLYSYRDSLQPVLQLELIFPAGIWYQTKRAVAMAVGALIKNGTSTKKAFEINEYIEQYGAGIKVNVGPDMASVSISCLTKHLAKLLPLLYELLTDSVFPQEELDLYIQNAKQRLSVQLRKGDFVANRLIDEHLFGYQHPYGSYVVSSDYDLLTREELIAYLKNHFTSSTCNMFLAGYFDDQEVETIVETLGKQSWNTVTPMTSPDFRVEPLTEKKFHVVNDENSVQGSIRIARLFPEKHHPDFYPMIMLNTLLGGYFGSRLMSNIREEKGYTYGIHSYLYNHLHQSALLITTEAGKDVCDACVNEVYKEMEILRTELVPEEELLLVKNYLLGNILGDLDGAFQIMQRWKSLILSGFPKEKFYENIQIYKSITPEGLQQLAQRYLIREDFYECIVT